MYAGSETAEAFGEQQQRFAKLVRSFKGALSRENHAKLTHDPRLDSIAHIAALAFGADETAPAEGLIRWALWKLGIAGYVHSTPSWWARYGNAKKRVVSTLKRIAEDFDGEGERYSFGVARVQASSETWAGAVVIVEKAVALAELPKHYEPGQRFVLRGRVLIPHERVWFNMTTEGQEVLTMRVNTDDSGWFLVETPVPAVPGRYFVELEVEREPNRAPSLLHVPIYVATPEPQEPDPIVLNPPSNPSDRLAWRERTLRMINEERRRFGLSPLRMDKPVSRLASIDASRATSSCCKPSQALRRRLREDGIRSDLSISWTGMFEYLEESVWRSMLDPEFRLLVLDDRLESYGAGFSRIPSEYRQAWLGRHYFFAAAPEERKLPNGVRAGLAEPFDSYAAHPSADGGGEPKGEDTALAESYAALLRGATGGRVAYEPAVDLLAETFAERPRFDWRLRQLMLWKLGVPGMVKAFERRVTAKETPSPYAVVALANEIEWDDESKNKIYSIGLTRRPLEGGFWLEVLVLVERNVELAGALPKHYRPGDDVVLEGRLLGDSEDVRFWMDMDDKRVFTEDFDVAKDGSFSIRVPAPNAAGRHFVQITTHSLDYDPEAKKVEGSNQTELFVPIYVGVQEPEKIDEAWIDPPADPVDHKEWPGIYERVYNAERERLGLPPLKRNETAAALVRDMLYLEEKEFDAPSFADIAEDLRDNGGSTAIHGSRDYPRNVEQAARWNLLYPAIRQVVLDEKVTMLATAVDEDGESYYEMFLSPPVVGANERKGRFLLSAVEIDRNWPEDRLGKLSGRQIRLVADENAGDVGECYRDKVSEDEDVAGQIEAEFVVGLTGEVLGANLVSSNAEHTTLEACLIEALRDWEFPAPQGERAAVARHVFQVGPNLREADDDG